MRTWLSLLPFALLVACSAYEPLSVSTRRDDARSSSTRQDQGGIDKVESAPPRAAKQTAGASAADAAERQQTGAAGKRAAGGSGGSSQTAPRDAGAAKSKPAEIDAGKPKQVEPDAGKPKPSAPDASKPKESAPDAGPDAASEQRAQNTGSCCSTSTQPGCGDVALRACVCEREPRCCSEAWDENCTRLVKEKHCQSGVRDCVCGYGEGQWQQAYCCQGGWNDTCESVSYNKCGATADCP